MSFDHVAVEYDEARPDYPDGVFDALGPIAGRTVIDVGAGTGIASRALLRRGAAVVAVDIGVGVLRKALDHTPSLAAVLADGAAMPVRSGAADLVCFAQSWHWLDERRRCDEVARVLRPDGRWAAWWSHARGDGDRWFDATWDVLERSCPGVHRRQRDVDWGEDVDRSGVLRVNDRVSVPWVRELSVDRWVTGHASLSYVAALDEAGRAAVLDRVRALAADRFRDGTMRVRYDTTLWLAGRR